MFPAGMPGLARIPAGLFAVIARIPVMDMKVKIVSVMLVSGLFCLAVLLGNIGAYLS